MSVQQEVGVHSILRKPKRVESIYTNIDENIAGKSESRQCREKTSRKKVKDFRDGFDDDPFADGFKFETVRRKDQSNQNASQIKRQINKPDQLTRKTNESCPNCKILTNSCLKMSEEIRENNDKDMDVTMLKTLVFRLNQELDAAQRRRFQNGQSEVLKNEGECERGMTAISRPVAWGDVNTHTLAPLLNAYDETINERQAIIDGYETTFERICERLNSIVDENNSLHTHLTKLNEQNRMSATATDKLGREVRLLRDRCHVIDDKWTAVVDGKNEEIRVLNRDKTTAVDALTVVREQLDVVREELKIALSNYHDALGLVKRSKQEREELEKTTIPRAVHENVLSEVKRFHEEKHESLRVDNASLKQEIKQLTVQMSEMERELANLRVGKSEMDVNFRAIEQILRKLQCKYDHCQTQLMNAQISRDTCQRQLQKALIFSREILHDQSAMTSNARDRPVQKKSEPSVKTQLCNLQRDAIDSLDELSVKIQQQNEQIATHALPNNYHHHSNVNANPKIIKLNSQIFGQRQRDVGNRPYLLHGEKNK